MNCDDDKAGQQRPIGGSDSIDEKITSTSPGPSSALPESDRPLGHRGSIERDAAAGDDGAAIIDTIFDADVLSGRGKTSFNHAGNKRFRDLVTASTPEYDNADSRLEKALVVHSVVESIRTAGGRFLKADQASGKWREMSDRACREKVGHAIRDAASIIQARQRKKRLQSQNSMSSSTRIVQSRGPISRYAEAKSDDAPDRISFHDISRFSNSNMMSGLPTNMALNNRSPGPIGVQNDGTRVFHTSFLSPPDLGLDQLNAGIAYQETKLDDTPQPISFHDMARFSNNNVMSGLSNTTALDHRSPGPIGVQNVGTRVFQTSFLSPPDLRLDQVNAGRADQETKLDDTPEHISFNDMSHFSNNNMIPGLPNNTALDNRSPGPIGVLNEGTGAFQTSFLSPPDLGLDQGNASRAGQDEHPPDEEEFMEQIEQVLGPMPPDHDEDPLAEKLELS